MELISPVITVDAPTDNLKLAASYTYTDSTSEDEQGIDSREIRRPRHTGSVQANYRFRSSRS